MNHGWFPLYATRWQLCMGGAHPSLQHRDQRDWQRKKTTMERCFMFAGEAAHLADQADRELLGEDQMEVESLDYWMLLTQSCFDLKCLGEIKTALYIFVLLANLLLLLRLCGKVPSMLLLALRATKTSRGQGFDFWTFARIRMQRDVRSCQSKGKVSWLLICSHNMGVELTRSVNILRSMQKVQLQPETWTFFGCTHGVFRKSVVGCRRFHFAKLRM